METRLTLCPCLPTALRTRCAPICAVHIHPAYRGTYSKTRTFLHHSNTRCTFCGFGHAAPPPCPLPLPTPALPPALLPAHLNSPSVHSSVRCVPATRRLLCPTPFPPALPAARPSLPTFYHATRHFRLLFAGTLPRDFTPTTTLPPRNLAGAMVCSTCRVDSWQPLPLGLFPYFPVRIPAVSPLGMVDLPQLLLLPPARSYGPFCLVFSLPAYLHFRKQPPAVRSASPGLVTFVRLAVARGDYLPSADGLPVWGIVSRTPL